MFGHNNEGVKEETAFAAIPIKRLKEESDVVLDHEQSFALPSRERYEIRSGRRDESSRLQEQPSAAKAAIFAYAKWHE